MGHRSHRKVYDYKTFRKRKKNRKESLLPGIRQRVLRTITILRHLNHCTLKKIDIIHIKELKTFLYKVTCKNDLKTSHGLEENIYKSYI